MKESFKEAVELFKAGLKSVPNALLEGDDITPTYEKFFEDKQVRSLFLDAANAVVNLYETNKITADEQAEMSKEIVRVLQIRMKNLGLKPADADDILCKLSDTKGIPDALQDALVSPSLT